MGGHQWGKFHIIFHDPELNCSFLVLQNCFQCSVRVIQEEGECIYIFDDFGIDRLNRKWKRSMMRILKGSVTTARHEAFPASGC